MENFKIAIVIRAFNRGGAEVLLREMFESEEFKKKIKNWDFIILDSKRVELLKDLKGNNTYVFNIFSSTFNTFFFEYYRLYKFIKLHNYKIIHAHLPNAGIVIRLLKFLLPKIKVVYTEHSIIEKYNRITYFLNGITYFKNDYTIFVSNDIREFVNKHKTPFFYWYGKGEVVLNGVNFNKYKCDSKINSTGRDYVTVGTVASIRKVKRLDLWVQVAETFKRRFPHILIHFIIAGGGPEKKIVEELISLKKLGIFFELPGIVINTVSVYQNIDIFLMTSEFEGLPVALLEAMSCECVPITSNVGGIKYLNFSEFGYKYEEFNSDNIASIIYKYCNNRLMILEEGKKAREFIIMNNGLNKQVEKYIDIYMSL